MFPAARKAVHLAAVIALACACGQPGSSPPKDSRWLDRAKPEAPPPEAATTLRLVGNDGAVVFALWPKHWDQVGELIARARASAPDEARRPLEKLAREVGDLPSLEVAVVVVLREFGVPIADKSVVLDRRQPVVVSLFAPTTDVGAQALAAVAPKSSGPAKNPGPLSRIVLPTNSPGTLMGDMLESLGRSQDFRRLSARTFAGRSVLVGLYSHDSAVEVRLLHGNDLADLAPATARTWLSSSQPTTATTRAGELFLAAHESVGRIWFRNHTFADTFAAWGMSRSANAIRSAISMQSEVMAAGLAESLVPLLVMDPGHQLVRDAVVDVTAERPTSIAVTLALTHWGREAFTAEPNLASGKWVRLEHADLLAIAKSAHAPQIIRRSSERDVGRLLMECGAGCWLDLGTGNFLGYLSRLWRLDAQDVERALRELIGEVFVGFDIRFVLRGRLLAIEALDGNAGYQKRVARVAARTDLEAPAAAASLCADRVLLELREALRAASRRERDPPARERLRAASRAPACATRPRDKVIKDLQRAVQLIEKAAPTGD